MQHFVLYWLLRSSHIQKNADCLKQLKYAGGTPLDIYTVHQLLLCLSVRNLSESKRAKVSTLREGMAGKPFQRNFTLTKIGLLCIFSSFHTHHLKLNGMWAWREYFAFKQILAKTGVDNYCGVKILFNLLTEMNFFGINNVC
jgi:hypothetical protein